MDYKVVDEEKITKSQGLILFSGGYDSVAILHRMITSNDFSKIVVLFENSPNLVNEYEIMNSKKIFDLFSKRYSQKYDVELEWLEEKLDVSWISKDTKYLYFERDICLMAHLMTILKHGEINNYYLGWNKSNVKYLNMSKMLLEWFESNKQNGYDIHFLENYFSGDDEHETKYRVIEYLLENKLFYLPYSSSKFNETIKEYKNRKTWFDNNPKEREVSQALMKITIFDSDDFSKIFSLRTTKEVQELYNKKQLKEKE